MAVYQLPVIIRDVRVCMDENPSSTALSALGDVDTLSTDELIKSKIIESVRRVHSEAPIQLLDCGHNFGDAIYWKDNESGWTLLPEDFMRFIMFQMDDWERPSFSPISTDSASYVRQSSRFKGIRGISQKPVCAISIRPEGRVLEFFSCKRNEAKVTKAVYLPYPKIDDYGGIEICSRCYDAVVYTAASLVIATYGDIERSRMFNELAKMTLI